MPKKNNEHLEGFINTKVTPKIEQGMRETAVLQGRTVSEIAREIFAKYIKDWLVKRY